MECNTENSGEGRYIKNRENVPGVKASGRDGDGSGGAGGASVGSGVSRATGAANAARERAKTAAIRAKENARGLTEDANETHEDETAYAEDKVTEHGRQAVSDLGSGVRKEAGKIKDKAEEKAREKVKEKIEERRGERETVRGSEYHGDASPARNVQTGRENVSGDTGRRTIKTRDNPQTIKTADSSRRTTVKTMEHTVKEAGHSVKTAEASARTTVKTAEKSAEAASKGVQASAKAAEEAAATAQKAGEAAAKAGEASIKAAVAAVKAAATAIKESASSIISVIGAGIPFVILGAVIMAVAVLCTGDTAREDSSDLTNIEIIQTINADWQDQINDIAGEAEVNIEGSRAPWSEVFALYTAMSAEKPEREWRKKKDISNTFWDMHYMSYGRYIRIEPGTAPEQPVTILMRSADRSFIYVEDGNIYVTETETYQNGRTIEEIMAQYPDREFTFVAEITISHRTVEEMAEEYGFSDYQREQAVVMTTPEFDSFWQEVLFGITGSNDDIVRVALSQLGNTGGYPYWEYSGFGSRVEWCACFVSWCAGQCGYVDSGKMINTGSPPQQVAFFKSQGHWADGSITPSSGMIIFFDWYNADFADHVGIVEKVEDGYVHTIEGNASDMVKQNVWGVGDGRILGYGWID